MLGNVIFDKEHRLRDFNYSAEGSYMITFNTMNRNPVLSRITTQTGAPEDAYAVLTEIGETVEKSILEIPKHYKNVSVDHYVIMPDHVHIMVSFSEDEVMKDLAHSKLSNIVHALKRVVTKQLGYSIWQLDFYDQVVFSEKEYDAFRMYIEDNPKVWLLKGGEPDIRALEE